MLIGSQPRKRPEPIVKSETLSTKKTKVNIIRGLGRRNEMNEPPRMIPMAIGKNEAIPVKKLADELDWRNWDSIYFGLNIRKPPMPM